MQEAIAIGLENSNKEQFFEKQLEAYTERRDILTSYFDQLGLSYTKPDGSYFLLVDMSPVKIPDGFEVPETCKGRGKDFALCWWLAQELKVVGIPPSEVSHFPRLTHMYVAETEELRALYHFAVITSRRQELG
jgi:kynurenine aminotransferase